MDWMSAKAVVRGGKGQEVVFRLHRGLGSTQRRSSNANFTTHQLENLTRIAKPLGPSAASAVRVTERNELQSCLRLLGKLHLALYQVSQQKRSAFPCENALPELNRCMQHSAVTAPNGKTIGWCRHDDKLDEKCDAIDAGMRRESASEDIETTCA